MALTIIADGKQIIVYMTSVKAIIWNVHPNVRCDAVLTSQAKLINKFAPKEVWNNVIVITKQSMSPEDDGRGAMAAALEYHSGANVQLLGYRYVSMNGSPVTIGSPITILS